jgi:hypothetical protein
MHHEGREIVRAWYDGEIKQSPGIYERVCLITCSCCCWRCCHRTEQSPNNNKNLTLSGKTADNLSDLKQAYLHNDRIMKIITHTRFTAFISRYMPCYLHTLLTELHFQEALRNEYQLPPSVMVMFLFVIQRTMLHSTHRQRVHTNAYYSSSQPTIPQHTPCTHVYQRNWQQELPSVCCSILSSSCSVFTFSRHGTHENSPPTVRTDVGCNSKNIILLSYQCMFGTSHSCSTSRPVHDPLKLYKADPFTTRSTAGFDSREGQNFSFLHNVKTVTVLARVFQ